MKKEIIKKILTGESTNTFLGGILAGVISTTFAPTLGIIGMMIIPILFVPFASSILKIIAARIKIPKKNKYDYSILRIFYKKRTGKLSLPILFISFFGIVLFQYLMKINSILIPLILFLYICIFSIEELLLIYRIKKDYYLTSEIEAREIIKFILEKSHKIDFTDKGKPKDIISNEDYQEIYKNLNKILPITNEVKI